MTSSPKIVRYLYLDAEGIDSLFAQMSDRLETEHFLTKGASKKESLIARLGIGGTLSFVQLLKADFQARTEKGTDERETRKSILTTEHKLIRLIEHLEKAVPTEITSDIVTAARASRDSGAPVFLKTRTTFDLPQFYGPEDWPSVNETQTIIWKKPSIFTPHDGDDGIKVVMTTSTYKHLSARNGSMGKTSHDALIFRASNGIRVPVNVFGLLSELPDGYHIKPYAIWS